jgi:hypothetical protein
VIAACAAHIPIPTIPAHVVVIRDGRRLTSPPRSTGGPTPPTTRTAGSSSTPRNVTTPTGPAPPPGTATPTSLFLQAGDRIRVARPAVFTFSYASNRFRIPHGQIRVDCRDLALNSTPNGPRTTLLAIRLQSGRVQVRSGVHARRALVLSPEMLAFATVRGTNFIVDRNPAARSTRASTLNQLIVAANASNQALRINAHVPYTAISDAKGLRLDIWPFSISSQQRPTTSGDRLVPFWADGQSCSVGCTAPGTIDGWPLKPFHQQHAIRAGINELRPANFHVAVDIEANNFEPVYAIQSGYARASPTGSIGDFRVDVGSFSYWHILPMVSNGQYVVAYKTEIGQVLHGFGHIALSEGNQSYFLNPLRPGGRLQPYTDTEPPIIGAPRVFADGRVIVGSFDPQSFIQRGSYETPVLAPSSLAWRLYDAHDRALSGLEWAMRGSQHYPTGLKPVIFAPGAANPGFECFYTKVRCIPNWVYWLAGGLTQPLPLSSLPPGRYRLTIYAWDWAGNKSALDYRIKLPLANAAAAPSGEFGPLGANFDYDETGAATLPAPNLTPTR